MNRIQRITWLVVMSLWLAQGSAVEASDTVLLRLFLHRGGTLVSYGEFARVADRVVFSTPVGEQPDSPRLHVVTVPASVVDWPRTDAYRASVRYQWYASARAKADFEVLESEVARVLSQIALTTEPEEALLIAEQARGALLTWPGAEFGYRQGEVDKILTLVETAISRLRSDGGDGFDLTLTASPPSVALEPVLGMPEPREQLHQIFLIARLTPDTAARVPLLESALQLLDETGEALSREERVAVRSAADSQIARERSIDAQYAQLARRVLRSASQASAAARIADVEAVLAELTDADDTLGNLRPEISQALRQSVSGYLESARRQRLLQDQTDFRRSLFAEYQAVVGPQMSDIVEVEAELTQIRRMDGPSLDDLIRVQRRLAGGAERLARLTVVSDLQPAHTLLTEAWRFAETAVGKRYDAARSGDLGLAREASSAAAGALILLTRAQEALQDLLEPLSARQ